MFTGTMATIASAVVVPVIAVVVTVLLVRGISRDEEGAGR